MLAYDVVIVGAGPGGLACAQITAAHGMKTLVLERKTIIGAKVCAGGITWSGLLSKLKDISEKSFKTQYIYSKNQSFTVSEDNPIIATVNREALGTLMRKNAEHSGAMVRLGCQVTSISGSTLSFIDKTSRKQTTVEFRTLVGADGSSSTVRKHINLPVIDFGVGINYMIKGDFPQMEWHLDSSLFGSGYSWIFPHKTHASIGAYADSKSLSAANLKNSLYSWATQRNINLAEATLTAERINYDYRGYRNGNIFLVGDAAGLASALTGEGIYPAMISGEAVGREICSNIQQSAGREMERLIRNHSIHRRMAKIARTHPAISTCLSEAVCYALRKNIINFRAAEMAH